MIMTVYIYTSSTCPGCADDVGGVNLTVQVRKEEKADDSNQSSNSDTDKVRRYFITETVSVRVRVKLSSL